jgi:hypothetical protein
MKIIPTVKGIDSYQMWLFHLKIVCHAREVLGVLRETEAKPAADRTSEVQKWEAKDAKAQYYVVTTVDSSITPHIMMCTTSKQMLDILNNIYQRDSNQQKCMLLQEFYNYKYDGNKDIMSNMSYVQNLAHKLNQPDLAIDKNMTITKILAILPEQYKYFSSAWDSVSEDLKTIENLCGRLQLEESKIRNQEKQENVSFTVEAKYKGKNINRHKNIKCYRCDSFGHVRA